MEHMFFKILETIWLELKVNGQLKFKSNNWTNKWTETYQIDMKENEIIDLEFAIIIIIQELVDLIVE